MTLRLGLRDDDGKAPAGLALDMRSLTVQVMAAACSLSEQEVTDLLLTDRVGTLLAQQGRRRNESLTQAATAAWVSPGRTRYCPDCLRGDDNGPGFWRTSWQLPWHYLCLRHLRALDDICPRCEAVVGQATPDGPFGALVPNPGVGDLPFDACRHRPGTSQVLCGHRLSDPGHEAGSPYPGDMAFDAQARLDNLLGLDHPTDPDAVPTIAGEAIGLGPWISALQAVVVLVRASTGLPGAPSPWPGTVWLATVLDDPTLPEAELRRLLHPNTPPEGADTAAAFIGMGVHILDAPTPEALADRLAPYREPVREHRPGVWKGWLRQYPDQHVKTLLKQHSRWGALSFATRTAPATASALRGNHLAQRLPEPHDRHLNPYRHVGLNDTGLHRATAVLLWQRLEGAGRRADAATALGYDQPGTVDGTVARLQKLLAAHNLDTAYNQSLTAILDGLAAAPVIDYAERRDRYRDWLVPEDDWDSLKAALVPLQPAGRPPDWDRRRLLVSQIIWEDLTGSEPHNSPAFRQVPPDQDSRTKFRNLSIQLRRHSATGTLPGFQAVLDGYRQRVQATP